jgi:hypothetical protein
MGDFYEIHSPDPIPQLEWLLSKRQKITNAGKDMEKKEF